jgi:hypothetical protein
MESLISEESWFTLWKHLLVYNKRVLKTIDNGDEMNN